MIKFLLINFFLVIECDNYFKRSLFLMGEIGGNDYNYPFFVGGTINQLKAMVPLVVQTIVAATSVSPTFNLIKSISIYNQKMLRVHIWNLCPSSIEMLYIWFEVSTQQRVWIQIFMDRLAHFRLIKLQVYLIFCCKFLIGFDRGRSSEFDGAREFADRLLRRVLDTVSNT